MRRIPLKSLPIAVALAAVAAGGCAHSGKPLLPYGSPCARPDSFPAEVDEPLGAAAAVCASWRQVGFKQKPDDACRVPEADKNRWKVGHLFDSDSTAPRESATYAASLPPALRPFCLYETDEKDSNTLQAMGKRLRKLLGGGNVSRSCGGVAPASTTKNSTKPTWQILKEYFEGRESVTWNVDYEPPTHPTNLVFLDTQPKGLQSPGKADHGFALAEVARSILCDDGRCRANIHHELALPIVDFDPNDLDKTTIDCDFNDAHQGPKDPGCNEGGYFGTIDQLAVALEKAVREHGRRGKKLVVALPVAWHGETFGGLEMWPRDMPQPVRAFYRALQIASCRDVLVVAAAGNRLGGPEVENGPLMPAAWETLSAPTRADCRKLDWAEKEPVEVSRFSNEPLIYAAAGLRKEGLPLVNARPGSIPPRVAYADNAVAVDRSSGRDEPIILTGSSVATTVVASVAASVWSEKRDLSRAEVMRLLENSGEPVESSPGQYLEADFHFGRGVRTAQRISHCQALLEVCEESNKPCPVESCPGAPNLAEYTAQSAACLSECIDLSQMKERKNDMAATLCTTQDMSFAATDEAPENPCPFLQFYGIAAKHWTGPQPGADPCPDCPARPPPPSGFAATEACMSPPGTYMLEIKVDPNWARVPASITKDNKITDIYFDVGDKRFSLGDLDPQVTSCKTVVGIPMSLLMPDKVSRPPLALRFNTAYGSFESPVTLIE